MEEKLKQLEKTNKKLLNVIIILLISIIIATILMTIEIYKYYNEAPCMPPTHVSILEIQNFNAKLSNGIGQNVAGSNVTSMLETVELMQREDDELDMTVTLDGRDITKDIDSAKKLIRIASRYNVESATSEEGFINSISITIREK